MSDELGTALEAIHASYEDDYPEWTEFAWDATDHAEELGVDVDFNDPDVYMPVVRWRFDADRLRGDPGLTPDHLDVLESFGRALANGGA